MPTARESFWVGRRLVRKGASVDRSDPVLDGRGHLFDSPVEQATAEPGKTRNVKLPGKVECDVDGCDYVGSKHGMAIHTGTVHKATG